jgi:nicotinate-nucleotide adenylyltransferase
VVYPRRDSNIDPATLPTTVSVVEADLLDISSTEIRRRVSQGLSVRGMVPDVILDDVRKYYS